MLVNKQKQTKFFSRCEGNMTRRLKKATIPVLVFALLLFTACLRVTWRSTDPMINTVQSMAIFFIYIGMIAVWAISIERRIMHRSIKKCLLFTAVCMIFWVFVRTCKNQIFYIGEWERWFWYMYYIPMTLIPLLGLFIAFYIGKPENEKLSKNCLLFLLPTVVLIVGILTNDMHRLAFYFTAENYNGKYEYGLLYYAVVVWIVDLLLVAIGVLWHKCRLPYSNKRIWLPLFVIVMGVIYCFLYWYDSTITGFGYIEMTAVYCTLTAALWESCIAVGLIPSNTKYEAFFYTSDIGAQIVDNSGQCRYLSKTATKVSCDTFEQLKKKNTFEPDCDTELRMKALRSGYVIWKEDLSEINRSIRELQSIEKELKDGAELLREEYIRRSQTLKIQEQMRIYNNIYKQTSGQIDKIESISDKLKDAGPESIRKILSEINVLGTYVKRRSNLILITESQKNISVEELVKCFEESIENLKLCGIYGAFSAGNVEEIDSQYAMLFYDLFEEIIESCISYLQTILAVISLHRNRIRFSVRFLVKEKTNGFSCSYQLKERLDKAKGKIIYEQQEDEDYVSVSFPERTVVS